MWAAPPQQLNYQSSMLSQALNMLDQGDYDGARRLAISHDVRFKNLAYSHSEIALNVYGAPTDTFKPFMPDCQLLWEEEVSCSLPCKPGMSRSNGQSYFGFSLQTNDFPHDLEDALRTQVAGRKVPIGRCLRGVDESQIEFEEGDDEELNISSR